MKEFDVVIVGSGTAGQTAAYDLNEKGLDVALIEKSDTPGGTCALWGCQAKKWYYEATETIARARHLFGKGFDTLPRADWSQIRKEKNKFTSRVPEGTVKGLKKAGITYIEGSARFIDSQTMETNGEKIKAKYYILATGAVPMPLPFEGSDNLISNVEFLDLEDLPGRVVFVGGGFISFEFAHFAARIGSDNREITILEVMDRPLGAFDAEMVDLLVEASEEDGIHVKTGVKISSVKKDSDSFKVRLDTGEAIEAGLVVHGAGRSPNIEALELESAEIEYSKKGISVNNRMQTNNPRVYAIGDCAATMQLARVADYEAHVAARNILSELKGAKAMEIDYEAAPAILFSYPEYAMAGKTEKDLQDQGIDYHKSFHSHLGFPNYRRVGLKHAAYKILVGSDGKFLGAHFLSDNASGMINAVKQAMVNGISAEELYWQSIMTPYPSRVSDLIYMLKPFVTDD